MNLSKFFIDRPIFAGVLSVLIFVAGLLALRAMPISEYPEVVPPSVVVRAQYPGANPKVIAETVATPIEEAINGVEDMLYMSSQATTDGLMTLTVTFKLGTDPDKAQQLVQNRVSQAEPRLPEEVRRLGVTTVKSSPDLTMVVHLLSPNDRYDIDLSAQLRAAQRQGPAGAHRRRRPGAAVRRAATIRCASGSIRRRSPSAACRPSDVVREIRAQNVQAAAGVVGASPSLPGRRPAALDQRAGPAAERGGVRRHRRQDRRERRGHAAARHRAASSSAPPNTRCARCSTTSRRSRSASSRRRARTRSRSPTTSRKTMAELKKNMPEGVDYQIVYDPTQFVRASIEAVVHTLLEAVALVVLVVILFLQTWRASIIPLLAVPVSIIGTFAVMYVFGFSINALSLFGLVLAIGIVVDDAIVVVENVERNIEDGLSPREATYQAMREVSGPIIAIALVLIAVFVPLAFISGLTGQFYKQFALTIAISTVISAINSLTLSPALAALLLKAPRRAEGRADARSWTACSAGSSAASTACSGAARDAYGGGVRRVISRKARDDGRLSRAGRRDLRPVQGGAGRLRAEPGQAISRRLRAAARRRDARPHRGRHPPHERHRAEAAGRRERGRVPGPVDQRLHQQLERRHRVRDAEAVRRAQDAGPERRRASPSS